MNKAEQIYLEQYSEYLTIKGYASTTIGTFTTTAQTFIKWLTKENIEIEHVSYNDILAYVNHKKNHGNKPRTMQLFISALNRFFNYMVEEHNLPENPASNVLIKGIKRKTLVEILSTEELETIYKTYSTENKIHKHNKIPPQKINQLARKRNKILLGLIIYQGLKTEELAKIELQDLQLKEGKINVQGGLRTNSRILKLEAHQVYDLIDYVNVTRKAILEATGKQSSKLFISVGTSLNFANIMQKLVKTIITKHKKVKDIKHIRTSVITNWLKVHNLRKVQYMAGHRYVSSTEAYQINNMEELQDDIKKYHPIS
jgi:site-specific recombinase XerD